MTAVLIAAVAVTGLAVTSAFAALRWQARGHARAEYAWQTERAELVSAMCMLAGRPLPDRGWRDPRPPADLPHVPLADASQIPKF